MEALKGILERIVYENEENGYVIARFSCREYGPEVLTVIGNLMSASPGENLLLKGDWVNHPGYGRQFRIFEYKTILPATVAGIKEEPKLLQCKREIHHMPKISGNVLSLIHDAAFQHQIAYLAFLY